MSRLHPQIADPAESVLVVIDCQERLWKVIDEREVLESRLRILVQGAQLLGIPVIFSEQNPDGLGATLASLRALAPHAAQIAKRTFCCGGTQAFIDAIHATERNTLVLCGVETHICVLQTALDALARGYKVHAVQDACGSRFPANRSAGLQRMGAAGAVLTVSESLLFEWMGSTESSAFRSIRDLIK